MTDNDWELEAQQAYERWLAVPVEASDAISPKDDEDGHDWFERSCRNCFLAGYRAGLPTESKT